MSKASNHIKWCIDKAKKEIEKEEEQIQKMREKYQYTPIIEIDIQKVEELLGVCQDMIKETKGII